MFPNVDSSAYYWVTCTSEITQSRFSMRYVPRCSYFLFSQKLTIRMPVVDVYQTLRMYQDV